MLVEGGGCGLIVEGRALWLRVEEQLPEPRRRGLGWWWGCCFTADTELAGALLGEDSAPQSLGLWAAAHPWPACQSPLLMAARLDWRPGQVSLITGIYVIICLHQAELRKVSLCSCFYSASGRQNSQGEKRSRRPSERPWLPPRCTPGAVERSGAVQRAVCQWAPVCFCGKCCLKNVRPSYFSVIIPLWKGLLERGCPKWQVGFTLYSRILSAFFIAAHFWYTETTPEFRRCLWGHHACRWRLLNDTLSDWRCFH